MAAGSHTVKLCSDRASESALKAVRDAFRNFGGQGFNRDLHTIQPPDRGLWRHHLVGFASVSPRHGEEAHARQFPD